MVLTSFDDYPIHQTPEPVAHTASSDRNHYDRYFFNGYTADGSLYFAAALGLYPNRSVMDAAFSIVRDGVQTSVHASRRAPLERSTLTVGPITVRVDEPLRRLTVTVAPNESGVSGAVTFAARSDVCEEPRFTMRAPGGRATFDYTRLTQFGTWTGELHVGDDAIVLGDGVLGSRDRSWGVRPVGEREDGAPAGLPQFFWLWSPVNFDDVCTHFDVQELPDGRRWHDNGVILPVTTTGHAEAEQMASVGWDIDWRPGTRRAEHARLTLVPFDGADRVIELEPVLDFQMLGIGYLHPVWGHGMWKGEDAVGVESWKLDELDPMAPMHLHVQQLCRAAMGERTGTGILEVLVIGPHQPAGFSGLLDPA